MALRILLPSLGKHGDKAGWLARRPPLPADADHWRAGPLLAETATTGRVYRASFSYRGRESIQPIRFCPLDMFLGMQTKRPTSWALAGPAPATTPIRMQRLSRFWTSDQGRGVRRIRRGYQPRGGQTLGQHFQGTRDKPDRSRAREPKKALYEEHSNHFFFFFFFFFEGVDNRLQPSGKHWQIPRPAFFWPRTKSHASTARCRDKGSCSRSERCRNLSATAPPLFKPFRFSESWCDARQPQRRADPVGATRKYCTGSQSCQDGAAQVGKKSLRQGIGNTRKVVADTDEGRLRSRASRLLHLRPSYSSRSGSMTAIAGGQHSRTCGQPRCVDGRSGMTHCAQSGYGVAQLRETLKDLPAEYFLAYI